ncbi:MAG: hypothetical protein LC739_04990 [Actinobacteria bacterium]|nr:hypothetical protein [Actinomycetota bacterium]
MSTPPSEGPLSESAPPEGPASSAPSTEASPSVTPESALPPASAPASTEGLTARLAKLWSLTIPRRLANRAPALADSFRDSAWTAVWPPVAAFAPVAGLLVGFLAAFVWPGLEHSYTESLVFMMLVIAGAILSGPVGMMLLVGYGAGSLLFGETFTSPFGYPNTLTRLVTAWGGKLIVLALLAFPAVLLPTLARRMVWPIVGKADPANRLAIHAGLYAAVSGFLVFVWAQAMVVLVRPVFVIPYRGDEPTFEAVNPVQNLWPWLVAAAVVTAAGRVIVESRVLGRSPRATAVAEEYRQWWVRTGRRPSPWQRAPVQVRVLVVSVLGTALLAGTYEHWLDPLIALFGIGVLETWRQGMLGDFAGGLGKAISRIPVIVRFVVAVVLAYGVAYLPVWALFDANSLRPLLYGALASMAVFYLLLSTPEGRSPTT